MSNPTLAILAGGKGSRMGGPKSELRLGQQPILEYLLDRFMWPGPTLVVTTPSRENPQGAQRFDAEAVDPIAGQGPLRGVLTALANATSEIVIITTVDMPNITTRQFHWLIHELCARPEAMGVMCLRSASATSAAQNRLEPFPCALRAGAIDAVRRQLGQRKHSVQTLIRQPAFIALDAPDDWCDDIWVNLNSPADFAAFTSVLARQRREQP